MPRRQDRNALVRHDSGSVVQEDLPSQLSALSLVGQTQPGPMYANYRSSGYNGNEIDINTMYYQAATQLSSLLASETEKKSKITQLEKEVASATKLSLDWQNSYNTLKARSVSLARFLIRGIS
jgi:hypothetical protein